MQTQQSQSDETIVQDFNNNEEQNNEGNQPIFEILDNPVSDDHPVDTMPYNHHQTIHVQEIAPELSDDLPQIQEVHVDHPDFIAEQPLEIKDEEPPKPNPEPEGLIQSDFQEDQLLKEIKKKFYDSRAIEMRRSLLVFLAIFLVSFLVNYNVQYEDVHRSENVIKSTACFLAIIIVGISYVKNDLRYVRPASFIYLQQQNLRFFYMDLSEFQGDELQKEQKQANLCSYIIHIVGIIFCTTFYLIYSDQSKTFDRLSGKLLLLAIIVSTSKMFLYQDGQFLQDDAPFFSFLTIAFILLVFSVIYIIICQNVSNQLFEQLLSNQEQRIMIKSILDNLEESIIITSEQQQRIDFVNDKFFNQFQDQMDEKPVPQGFVKNKRPPCHQRILCCFQRQKRLGDSKVQSSDKFLEMKILTKVKSFIQSEQMFINYQQQNQEDTYSFNDILLKMPQDFQNLIYFSKSEENKEDIKYFQIKLKKFQRNHERMIMLQLIDISQQILYDQQKAQNQVLQMINAQVSHEMRNPLNSIAAQNIQKHALYLDLKKVVKEFEENAIKNNFLTQKQQLINSFNKIFVQLINGFKVQDSSVNLLTFIVQDLLDFAQIKSGNFRKNINDFNILDAVEEVMMIQRRKAHDNNINLTVSSVCGNPIIQTDRQRVMQVLLGLQSNALKFTQNGDVQIIVQVQEKELKIQVKDQGIGISKENQKNLFKFFGKVQENKQINTSGVGLGLVISKQIVKQFNGDITVESELGVGSTFTFTFEISQYSELQTQQIKQNLDKQVQTLNSRSLVFPLKFQKYVRNLNIERILSLNNQLDVSSDSDDPDLQKILIVDDQSFNIDALLIILKYRIGLNTKLYCVTALSGKQALNLIREDVSKSLKKSSFCLILMDCNMPDQDGYETTMQIREFLCQNNMKQPIISAVTGHTEQVYINKAFQSGMNQVMSKPVPVDLLREMVMKLGFPIQEENEK